MIPIVNIIFAGLVISGVYYDPIQAENGGEAVQLENSGPTPVTLDNATLLTKSSSLTLPAVTLLPGQGYLIADAGWSTLRDNITWPLADYEITLSLANTDGFAELIIGNTSMDRLAWNTSNSTKAREGYMITHEGEQHPAFRNSNSTATDVPVMVIVADAAPNILNITVTDDSSTDGIQVLAYNRTIAVRVDAQEPNGDAMTGTINFLGREYELAPDMTTNNTNTTSVAAFTAFIPLSNPLPGKFTLTAHVRDSTSEAIATQEITILSTTSVTVNGTLRFSGLPGALATSEVLVQNNGNAARSISIETTENMTCADTPFVLDAGAERQVSCNMIIPQGAARTTEGRARFIAT